MAQATQKVTADRKPDTPFTDEHPTTVVDCDGLLDILGDDYVQEVIEVLSNESSYTAARDITKQTSMSKPTVYRRLNTLEEIGLITSETRIDTDGHHRKAFSLTETDFELTFDAGISITQLNQNNT